MSPDRILKTLMPSTYIRLLAQDFPSHNQLAHGVGIKAEVLPTYARSVTVAQHLQCVRNAISMARNPDWHLRWGQRMAENFHGPVTLAMLTAPSLGKGLEAFIKFIPERVPYHTWRRVNTPQSARFEVTELIDLDITRSTLVEVPLIVMYEYVRIFHLGNFTAAAIELSYEKPRHAAYFSRWFACPIKFDCEQNALVIPHSWLTLENPGYDEFAWRAAIERCDVMRARADTRDTVAEVARLVSEHFDATSATSLPTADEIAASLGISSRTLIRRLREQKATYRSVVDDVQKQRAKSLLANKHYRLHEVASRLGYSDPKNFRRAFKRWFGITPSAYRNKLDRR